MRVAGGGFGRGGLRGGLRGAALRGSGGRDAPRSGRGNGRIRRRKILRRRSGRLPRRNFSGRRPRRDGARSCREGRGGLRRGIRAFGGVGWSLADFDVQKNTVNGAIGELFDNGLCGGLLRLGFSFPAGLLLARVFRPAKIRGAFWICAGCVAALLSAPYVGGEADLLKNGLYDAFCVIFAFPCIVFLGASGSAPGAVSEKICRFLGDISYPVYIIHYPSFYLFYAWIFGSGRTFADAWSAALPLVAGNVLAAYLFLKFFDEPLRRRLARLLKIGRRG